MTWVEFHDLFMGKYFPDTARNTKAQEFLELKQGTMNVMEYVARFTELACAKVMRFENGLKLSIRGWIVGLRLRDMDSMVGTALTIEREIEDARSTREASIQMAPYEALYWRPCRSPLCWTEVGESSITGLDLIRDTSKKVSLIRQRLLMAQSEKKSYADVRRRPLEFEVGDHVFLKVMPKR